MLSSLKSLASSSAIKAAYIINEEQSFYAGAWLVQEAVKKSTKQEVSVLTFSKKSLEQPLQRTSSSMRQGFDVVYVQLKAEAATLARLRHPAMLEVVEPIEESRSSITFVTERVTGCLASLVNDEQDSGSSRRTRGDANRLDEIEIQKGLLQITIGLEFLQSVAQIVHGNLVPEAIFINAKGDWKLGGFSFSMSTKDAVHYTPPDYDSRLPRVVQRNLDYAAPEFVIDETIDPLNDMFSLGCLICALVSSKHQSLIQCQQNIHMYRKAIDNLSPSSVAGIPPYLRDVLPQLLTRRPANRLSAHAFQSSPFFDNILMNSIRFLDAFPEKTTSERQSFMRGLQSVIPQFPPRVLTKKILPGLLDQFQDVQLLPLILPNVFLIAEGMTQKNFSGSVLPKLRPIFKITDSPAASMFLLEKMQMLKSKVTSLELKEDVMTLVYTTLANDIQYLQEKALKMSADLVKDLDLVTVKTALFPKIAEVFLRTTMLSIKVTSLTTFDILVNHNLDKYTITEKILPLLKGIKTKEPDVAMASLALAKSCGLKIDHENIAVDLLPQMWSMSLSPLLSQSQFRQFMAVIKELSTRVETEQAKKLSDSGAPPGSAKIPSGGDLMGDTNAAPAEDISFELLVLGGKPKAAQSTYQASRTATPELTTSSFSWATPPQLSTPQFEQKTSAGQSMTYPTLQPAPSGGHPMYTSSQSTHQTQPPIDWSTAARAPPLHQNVDWSKPQANGHLNKLPPPPAGTSRGGLDAYQSLL